MESYNTSFKREENRARKKYFILQQLIIFIHKALNDDFESYRVHTKIMWQPFSKAFSRTTFNFQGSPTKTVTSQMVHKYTLPVQANRTLRFEHYLLHLLLYIIFSVHFSSIFSHNFLHNTKPFMQVTLTSLNYDLHSVLDNHKAF